MKVRHVIVGLPFAMFWVLLWVVVSAPEPAGRARARHA